MSKNIIGHSFGRLTAVDECKRNGHIFIRCECVCGNVIEVLKTSLTRKKRPTKSCGCLKNGRHKKADQHFIDIFIKNDSLNDKVFCRTSSSDWLIFCKKCSTDEFSEKQPHNKRGVFKTTCSRLYEGKTPCRCSGKFRYSEKDWEFRVNLAFSSTDYELVRIVDFRNKNSKVVARCPDHGEWDSSTLHTIVYEERGCPACSHGGFNSKSGGYLYLTTWGNDDLKFLKIGITGKHPYKRLRAQLRNTDYELLNNHIWYFENGLDAVKYEKQFLNTLDKIDMDKNLFSDGFTEVVKYSYKNLKTVCEILGEPLL